MGGSTDKLLQDSELPAGEIFDDELTDDELDELEALGAAEDADRLLGAPDA